MKLKSNVISLFAIQAANLITPLLATPLITRALSLEQVGRALLLISIIGLAFVPYDHGLNAFANGRISKLKNSNSKIKKINHLISASSAARIFFIIFSAIAIELTGYINPVLDRFEYYLVLLGVILTGFQYQWIHLSMAGGYWIASFTAIGRIFYLALILLNRDKITSGSDVVEFWIFGLLVTASMSIAYIYISGIRPLISPFKLLKRYYQMILPFFLSRINGALYTTAPASIIAYTTGGSSVAIFRTAEQVFRAGQGLTSPFIGALYPYLASKRDVAILYKWIKILTVPVLIFSLLVSIYSTELLIYIYGSEYKDGTSVLRAFMILLVVNYFGTIMGFPAFATVSAATRANASVNRAATFFLAGCILVHMYFELDAIKIIGIMILTEFYVFISRLYEFSKHAKRN